MKNKGIALKARFSEPMNTRAMERELLQDVPPTELIGRLSSESLQGYLNRMIGRRGISVDALAELAALNRASLYKIMSGVTKHPQRNVLIRLALVLRLGFSETQELLHYGGRANLSARRARDIIISDGIINGRSIDEVNDRLQAHCYVDLYSKE